MEYDRKQISIPFTPPAGEQVDHQSAVMSLSLQMLALLSPPHSSHLVSCNLLAFLSLSPPPSSRGKVTLLLDLLRYIFPRLVTRKILQSSPSLLNFLICIYVALKKNRESLTCRHAQN